MSTSVFRGLNNVTDPLRLGLEWLVRADNVDITDAGAIARRRGYRRVLVGALSAAYTTRDFSRMYVVDGGVLKAVSADGTLALPLVSGLGPGRMNWTEVNGQVFFNNGAQDGIIEADNSVIAWRWGTPAAPTLSAVTGSLAPGLYQVRCTARLADGRTTGAGDSAELVVGEREALQITGTGDSIYICPPGSTVYQYAGRGPSLTWNTPPDGLGADLRDMFNDPLPLGAGIIQAWRGRLYAAQHIADGDQSAVWVSQALGFHIFDLNSAYLLIPGQVRMMAPHDGALVIGTDRCIYAYDGKSLTQLADYGVVPGHHWATDNSADGDRTLFWSLRGLCSVMPFKNLTEHQVSVPPGIEAGAAVVHADGQKRYLVALKQGGVSFNSNS